MTLPYRLLDGEWSTDEQRRAVSGPSLMALNVADHDRVLARWVDESESFAIAVLEMNGRTPGPGLQAAIRRRLDAEPGVWTPFATFLYRNGHPQDALGALRTDFVAWVKDQADVEALIGATDVRTAHTRRLVASHATVWSPDLVRALRARTDDWAWGALALRIAKNRALDSTSAKTLADTLWAAIYGGRQSAHGTEDVRAMRLMIERGVPLLGDPVEWVGHVPPLSEREPVGRGVAVLVTHARRDLTEGQFNWLFARVRRDPMGMAALVAHPDCPVTLAQRALETLSTAHVRHAVVKHERYLVVPAIRTLLLSTGADSVVLRAVLPFASADERDASFERVARKNGAAAARLLAEGVRGADGRAIGVTPETLAGLLERTRDEAHALALSALHQVTLRETAPAPLGPGAPTRVTKRRRS